MKKKQFSLLAIYRIFDSSKKFSVSNLWSDILKETNITNSVLY